MNTSETQKREVKKINHSLDNLTNNCIHTSQNQDDDDDKTQQLQPPQQHKINKQPQQEIQSDSDSSFTQQNCQHNATNDQLGQKKFKYLQGRSKTDIKSKKQIIKELFASKPKIPGARRFIKDGQVYYRTKTKHFQPQKHYFHQKQSNIMKSWIYGNGKTNDKVFLASWNINGIRNALHKPQVKLYIKEANPDILCITQHKIDQLNYKRKPVIISGYNGYWNFCKCSAGYSGIAVFSKFMPISAYQDFQQKQFSQQGRVLTLEFQKFYLVTAYIPAAGYNLERLHFKVKQFQVVFRRHCQKLLQKKYVIITGDLNVCHTSLDYHIAKQVSPQSKQQSYTPAEKKSFQKLLNMGFTDTFRKLNPNVRKYSWWNVQRLGREKNLGKRLDYFLIDNRIVDIVVKSEIRSEVQGSDHCPIQMKIEWSKSQKLQQKQKIQQTKQISELQKRDNNLNNKKKRIVCQLKQQAVSYIKQIKLSQVEKTRKQNKQTE